jgi:hypothetical protein
VSASLINYRYGQYRLPVPGVGWSVSTRMFSEDQLERLRTFPDIGRDDLVRYFTLSPAELAFTIRAMVGGRRTGLVLPFNWRHCRAWVRAR